VVLGGLLTAVTLNMLVVPALFLRYGVERPGPAGAAAPGAGAGAGRTQYRILLSNHARRTEPWQENAGSTNKHRPFTRHQERKFG
jgi:hypothetical protein